jgi:hypothetical protein
MGLSAGKEATTWASFPTAEVHDSQIEHSGDRIKHLEVRSSSLAADLHRQLIVQAFNAALKPSRPPAP